MLPLDMGNCIETLSIKNDYQLEKGLTKMMYTLINKNVANPVPYYATSIFEIAEYFKTLPILDNAEYVIYVSDEED